MANKVGVTHKGGKANFNFGGNAVSAVSCTKMCIDWNYPAMSHFKINHLAGTKYSMLHKMCTKR